MILRLNKKGIKRLQKIREDIKRDGKTSSCPYWENYFRNCPKKLLDKLNNNSCFICETIFPRINEGSCPCDLYSPRHLINKISQICDGKVEI